MAAFLQWALLSGAIAASLVVLWSTQPAATLSSAGGQLFTGACACCSAGATRSRISTPNSALGKRCRAVGAGQEDQPDLAAADGAETADAATADALPAPSAAEAAGPVKVAHEADIGAAQRNGVDNSSSSTPNTKRSRHAAAAIEDVHSPAVQPASTTAQPQARLTRDP